MVASTVVEPSAAADTADGSAADSGVISGAALLAVTADPSRHALLQALTAGTTCVCELQAQVPVAANLLSYHLRVLREAGLIAASRRGRWVDYTIACDALGRLHAAVPSPAGGERP